MQTLRHLVPAPPGALLVAAALLLGALVFATPGSAASMPEPKGKAVMAWHVTIAPSWFDPSSAPPQITPFGMLYATHDALVRPYPGQKMGPSLAESWEESEDGKFGFERYKGAGAATLHDHAVEIVDPRVVRFHLKEPWPDFMTFYGTTAGAAGIVVPKKYLTEVGHGFKKHPIGADGMTGWFRLSTKVPAFNSVYG